MSDGYNYIIVESYYLENTSGHRGDVHIRPAEGQIYPQELMVQHSKRMVDTGMYPVGTKFRWKVRLVTKASGTQFLGSHHAWPFDVVTEEEFSALHPQISKPPVGLEDDETVDPIEPVGKANPIPVSSLNRQFLRDESVRSWVLRNSIGICECCNKGAPFSGADGTPYLEVHHVRHLAHGGSDTLSNTVAVCPNCHRELHHGNLKETQIERLYSLVQRLIKE
jgi:hypothetical protein